MYIFFQRLLLLVGPCVVTTVKEVFRSEESLISLIKLLLPSFLYMLVLNVWAALGPLASATLFIKWSPRLLLLDCGLFYPTSSIPCKLLLCQVEKALDNANLVQELLHTMSLKKGGIGYMALKIDMEKALDRLEWSFICDTLLFFRIPPYLVMSSKVASLPHLSLSSLMVVPLTPAAT